MIERGFRGGPCDEDRIIRTDSVLAESAPVKSSGPVTERVDRHHPNLRFTKCRILESPHLDCPSRDFTRTILAVLYLPYSTSLQMAVMSSSRAHQPSLASL